MKQVIVFTDAFGNTKRCNTQPEPNYDTIHGYSNNGWRVIHVQGSEGWYCFVLEKNLE